MPLKLVQIIGPIGYFLSMTEVPVEMSFLYRDDFLKIGDGVRSVTDEQIIQEIAARGGIDSTTRIELFGHGNEDDKLSHRIDLLVSKVDVYSDTPEEKAAKEEYNSVHSQTSHTIRILDIISNHAPLQIHIYSCHGGAAAKDVAILAEGSAIIGHVSNKHVTTLPNIHLIKMNANIAKHSGNYSIVQSLLTDFMLHLMPEAILGVKVALSSSTDDGVRIMRFDMPFDFIVTKEDGEKYLRELYGKYLDFVEEHKLFPGHMSKESVIASSVAFSEVEIKRYISECILHLGYDIGMFSDPYKNEFTHPKLLTWLNTATPEQVSELALYPAGCIADKVITMYNVLGAEHQSLMYDVGEVDLLTLLLIQVNNDELSKVLRQKSYAVKSPYSMESFLMTFIPLILSGSVQHTAVFELANVYFYNYVAFNSRFIANTNVALASIKDDTNIESELFAREFRRNLQVGNIKAMHRKIDIAHDFPMLMLTFREIIIGDIELLPEIEHIFSRLTPDEVQYACVLGFKYAATALTMYQMLRGYHYFFGQKYSYDFSNLAKNLGLLPDLRDFIEYLYSISKDDTRYLYNRLEIFLEYGLENEFIETLDKVVIDERLHKFVMGTPSTHKKIWAAKAIYYKIGDLEKYNLLLEVLKYHCDRNQDIINEFIDIILPTDADFNKIVSHIVSGHDTSTHGISKLIDYILLSNNKALKSGLIKELEVYLVNSDQGVQKIKNLLNFMMWKEIGGKHVIPEMFKLSIEHGNGLLFKQVFIEAFMGVSPIEEFIEVLNFFANDNCFKDKIFNQIESIFHSKDLNKIKINFIAKMMSYNLEKREGNWLPELFDYCLNTFFAEQHGENSLSRYEITSFYFDLDRVASRSVEGKKNMHKLITYILTNENAVNFRNKALTDKYHIFHHKLVENKRYLDEIDEDIARGARIRVAPDKTIPSLSDGISAGLSVAGGFISAIGIKFGITSKTTDDANIMQKTLLPNNTQSHKYYAKQRSSDPVFTKSMDLRDIPSLVETYKLSKTLWHGAKNAIKYLQKKKAISNSKILSVKKKITSWEKISFTLKKLKIIAEIKIDSSSGNVSKAVVIDKTTLYYLDILMYKVYNQLSKDERKDTKLNLSTEFMLLNKMIFDMLDILQEFKSLKDKEEVSKYEMKILKDKVKTLDKEYTALHAKILARSREMVRLKRPTVIVEISATSENSELDSTLHFLDTGTLIDENERKQLIAHMDRVVDRFSVLEGSSLDDIYTVRKTKETESEILEYKLHEELRCITNKKSDQYKTVHDLLARVDKLTETMNFLSIEYEALKQKTTSWFSFPTYAEFAIIKTKLESCDLELDAVNEQYEKFKIRQSILSPISQSEKSKHNISKRINVDPATVSLSAYRAIVISFADNIMKEYKFANSIMPALEVDDSHDLSSVTTSSVSIIEDKLVFFADKIHDCTDLAGKELENYENELEMLFALRETLYKEYEKIFANKGANKEELRNFKNGIMSFLDIVKKFEDKFLDSGSKLNL